METQNGATSHTDTKRLTPGHILQAVTNRLDGDSRLFNYRVRDEQTDYLGHKE